MNDADCRATGVQTRKHRQLLLRERKQKRKETSSETAVAVFCLFNSREKGVLCLDKRREEKKQVTNNIKMQIYSNINE